MAFGGVAAPVNDEVGPVFDFAERARDFTTQLGGDFGWAVSERGVAVDDAADQFGEKHRLPLGFAGDVAEAVNERHVRPVEVLGGRFNRVVNSRGFAVD